MGDEALSERAQRLSRRADTVVTGADLDERLKEGKPLRVKLGLDPSSGGGDQTIYGWIDFDQETVELDMEEKPDDEDTDATDVVLWRWTHGDNLVDQLTIRYRHRSERFVGNLNAQRPECVGDRRIRLRRSTADGARLIGRTRTMSKGGWRIDRSVNRGRYWASAAREVIESGDTTVVCEHVASPTIKVE